MGIDRPRPAGMFMVFAAVLAMLGRSSLMFMALIGLGIVVIFPLGYAYVALVFLLRRWGSRAGWVVA